MIPFYSTLCPKISHKYFKSLNKFNTNLLKLDDLIPYQDIRLKSKKGKDSEKNVSISFRSELLCFLDKFRELNS